MTILTYEQAKTESQATGKVVMFRENNLLGVMRFWQGNWYWINVRTVKRRAAANAAAT